MGVLLVQQPPPPIRIHGMFTDEEKGLINMDQVTACNEARYGCSLWCFGAIYCCFDVTTGTCYLTVLNPESKHSDGGEEEATDRTQGPI